ncbi:UDP-forming cellulose synthase catalytic subunit, partial [Xanthomonas perforans]|nr:UDP-forming cellulose synthase catalytic subunit [Xanthomonas perforans]
VEQTLPAVVRQDRDGQVSIQFTQMSMEQERWLVASTFARADIWLLQWGQHDRDAFWRSMGQVLEASARGFGRLGGHIVDSARQGFRPRRPVDLES